MENRNRIIDILRYTRVYPLSTTIKLSLETKAKLDKAKIHPRETYEDVILRLLDSQPLKVERKVLYRRGEAK